MTVPYTFGTATTSIPLSNLDSNFNTPITLGNTSIYLGNTTTTIGNLTLTNVTISSGTANITSNITYATANAVVFTNSSSIGTTNANLTWNGTNLGITGTLSASGATTFTAGTASTSTTTGTTVITGGLGVSGRINAANFDGIVGANTAAAGSFTTLSATGVATFSAGTVSLPAITTTGDTNTGIYFPAADTIAFTEGGAESMRIDSSGKVLIGNSTAISTSPRLQVFRSDATVGGTSYQLAWFSNATGYGNGIGIYAQDNVCGISADFSGASGGASALAFYTNSTTTPLSPTERMRIDSTGKVGIGTTTPPQLLSISGASNPAINVTNTAGTSSNFYCTTTEGVIGTSSGNAFAFHTSNTERMRIDTSGTLFIGATSSPSGTQRLVLTANGSAGIEPMLINELRSTSATENYVIFYRNGSQVGSITNTLSATAYNTSSDYRLKENIVDAPSGNIDDIKVRSFDWIADGSHQEYGMVAQELLEVAPYAVNKPKNPDEMMQVDYSKLVPMMIKEIQDLKQRIATLENK